MRRRRFITLIGGTAAMWPLAARAQQPDRIRRIGVFSGAAEDDQDNKARIAVFVKELQQLGWSDGRNLRIDYRFAAGNSENFPKYATELVALGARRHSDQWRCSGVNAPSHPHGANRICVCRRSGRRRFH